MVHFTSSAFCISIIGFWIEKIQNPALAL